nr:RNA polymerase-binding protein DksA [Thiomonas sp. FB-Cd]
MGKAPGKAVLERATAAQPKIHAPAAGARARTSAARTTASPPASPAPAKSAAAATRDPVRATLPPAKPVMSAATTAPRPLAHASTSVPKPMSSIAPASIPTKVDPKLANAWKSKAPQDLTDAEVLAMPESEYMKSVQLDFFKHRLSALRNELIRSAGETTEHLREDTLLVPDPADRATIEEEHALELRTRDRERKLLKKIEQALALIDNGEYGWCEETGEPIGIGRLLARPTATLSLEAQQRREMKQKMYGD